MNFLIANTFTDSLAKLTVQEQKAVKTTAFDLQMNPAAPGLSLHKLDGARDKNFWSARVNADIRIILHKTNDSLLLAYVGHHDDAYGWAERRKLERHPTTGAMQMVEIRERVAEIITPAPFASTAAAADVRQERFLPPLFRNLSHDDLMAVGVPADWIGDVHDASEDSFFDLADHLPEEAVEALLNYVATGELTPPVVAAASEDPFAHPDAARRFRTLDNVEELSRALDYPWEKWAVFLHPAQAALVARIYSGPARVSGSAGTGKTVVALHRAVHLARQHPGAKVVLATFSPALVQALRRKLRVLAGNEPAVSDRIAVKTLAELGQELYAAHFGAAVLATEHSVRAALQTAAQAAKSSFSPGFLYGEWIDVVDAWQIDSWEAYRDVARLGRKTRIGGRQREELWSVFSRVRGELRTRGEVTQAEILAKLSAHYTGHAARPFDFAVVDEAQDISVAELRFLSALAGDRPDGLFLAGDLGQRIFQQPFSWKSCGVDIRGRSHTLRINYRTSHQIRTQADRLLPDALSDVDGNADSRRGTVSVFDGPQPVIKLLDTEDDEVAAVAAFISDRINGGVEPQEIGVFVRSDQEIARALAAVDLADMLAVSLITQDMAKDDAVVVGLMHQAKGMEFRAVAVMACDDEVLPLQNRIETISDAADLEEVYNTERHLLYVACTRAREFLLVTGAKPGSEFLTDLFQGT